MKALIIEDSQLAQIELQTLLKPYPEIEILDCIADGDSAIKAIDLLQPDVIFLDIHLPGKTGFEILDQLSYVPSVIFTTAYDQYAIKGFDYNALDYLLKPIRKERLNNTIQKLIAHHKENNGHRHLFFKEGEQCWFVRTNDIFLLESVGNYSKVYFEENQPMIYKSLNRICESLPMTCFFRANRQQVFNIDYIESVITSSQNGLTITLRGGKKIELSRRASKSFKDMQLQTKG